MKRLLLFLFLLFLLSAIEAQQKDTIVNKSITITRKYQPKIDNHSKIVSTPKLKKTTIKKRTPQYVNIATSMNFNYKLQLLKPQKLMFRTKDYCTKMLRFGLGTPINTIADLIVPIYDNEEKRFTFSFNHRGTFHNKKYSETKALFDFEQTFDRLVLYAKMGGKHNFFNYYGNVFMNDSVLNNPTQYYNTAYKTDNAKTILLKDLYQLKDRDNHFRFHSILGIRSFAITDLLNLNADLSYKMFHSATYNTTEHQSRFKSGATYQFNQNAIGLDFDFVHLAYNSDNNDFRTINNDYINYSVLKINPYYQIEQEEWLLKLGIKAGISMSAGQPFTTLPDIAFQWNVVPEYFSLLATVTGDITINSMDKIYNENRYLAPQNRIEDTYIPLNAILKTTVSPTDNFIFDVFAQYQLIDNPYFYVNKRYKSLLTPNNVFHNRFDVVIEKTAIKKTSVGASLFWSDNEALSFYFKGKYNQWTLNQQQYAWHLPKWETNWGVDIKINKKVEIGSFFIFEDGRYALINNTKGIKMKPVVDWNISASYQYSKRFSLFVKANNILNQKYQLFNGYNVQDFNTIVGASIFF